jgi:uncharacterized protein
MISKILVLPGIGNSGPEHWQTLWEASDPAMTRIVHSEWDAPDCRVWVRELGAAVVASGPDTVLVAHSLACLTVAHWAAESPRPIAGALLVSVPNPDLPAFPAEASHFSPVPMRRLPFPSLVVSSTDDPYASADWMRRCAGAWGSRFHSVGACGHINASSNLGDWAEGRKLLADLLA